ncbi:MAG: TatD family hydrolase [Gemmataceae bacterium]
MSLSRSPLVDTHAHLFDDRFAKDLPAVLDRARDAGVVRMIAVGIDAASNRASVELAKQHDRLVAAVGIQPNHVAEAGPNDWDEVVRQAESEPSVVAIGETGLDRYWDKTPFADQEEMFARHLALGRRLDKAVIIHCREAEADVARMLKTEYERHGPIRAVLHSYTGDLQTARDCLAMGLYVSFAGMVTYKTAGDLREIAKVIPAERILVETDCPYLAPQPVRGKRNEPSFVAHTTAALSAERGEELTAFCQQTTRNANELFKLGL